MKLSVRRFLRLFITGFSMGTADLIPGVSGGTIAFLSGIYEELLYSIKIVTGKVPSLVFQGKMREAVRLIPFRFLIPLGLGIGTALFGFAHLLSWLLETWPIPVWSFFFGLVLASTAIVLKRIPTWKGSYIILFFLSALFAYILVGATPVHTPDTPWFIFLSGAIAICAMILPGISGSFILLLLGKYHQILSAVVERDVGTLGIFILGCVLGISFFARFLTWLFLRYHNISVSILAGFMLGSIRKIWPWKSLVIDARAEMEATTSLFEKNVLPPAFDGTVMIAMSFFIVGIIIVFLLDRAKFMKEHVQDIANQAFVREHKSSTGSEDRS